MGWKNKDRHKEYCKEYYQKNKEKLKADKVKYRQENKKQVYQTNLKYNSENPHINKISMWKGRGVKLRPGEDWDSIYLFYITCENCELCNRVLTDENYCSSTHRTLDHEHETGFIRNILCHKCNVLRDYPI